MRIEKFLDADAALLCVTPKLSHADISSLRAEKCHMGYLWRRLQKEIELFAVKVRS